MQLTPSPADTLSLATGTVVTENSLTEVIDIKVSYRPEQLQLKRFGMCQAEK